MGRVGRKHLRDNDKKNDLSESEIGDGDNRRSRDHQAQKFSTCSNSENKSHLDGLKIPSGRILLDFRQLFLCQEMNDSPQHSNTYTLDSTTGSYYFRFFLVTLIFSFYSF